MAGTRGRARFTRDRNASNSPDQRYDTMIHMQLYGARTWEVAVPNGTYSVHIVAGDPSYTDSNMAITAEGNVIVSGALSNANHFLDGTKTVTVSDGKLTIGNGAGAVNDKLCFIQITSTSTTPPPTPTVSIAATDPSASEIGPDTGTFQVTRTGRHVGGADGAIWHRRERDQRDGLRLAERQRDDRGRCELCEHHDQAARGCGGGRQRKRHVDAGGGAGNYAGDIIGDGEHRGWHRTPVSNGSWPTSWATGAPLSKQRWESTSTAMNGKIYLFGGWMSAGSTGTQEYDSYNPATNTWTYLGYMPVSHTHSALAADRGE